MEQKKNKVQKADDKSVSQPIAKPLVVRSPKIIRLVMCESKISYVNKKGGKWLLYNPS